MSANIEVFEIAIRGAEVVAADPILLPLTKKWDSDIAASAELSAADLNGARLIRTLRGADGSRWDVTLVRDTAGAWSVETVEADASADGDADYVGDVVFIVGDEIAAAA